MGRPRKNPTPEEADAQIAELAHAAGVAESAPRSVEQAGRAEVDIRPATIDDVPRLTEIYNHYLVHTAITFDLDPVTVAERREWFGQFAETGRHQLLVATGADGVVGYAGSHQFRTKKAYDTTVETTIYCAPGALGRGIGGTLYAALFEALGREDVRLAVAGITVPNEASIALHERCGFVHAGRMHAVGRKFGRFWDVEWMEKELGA